MIKEEIIFGISMTQVWIKNWMDRNPDNDDFKNDARQDNSIIQ